MSWTRWAGLEIESSLPQELLEKAIDLLQENYSKEMTEWHTKELPKQMKPFLIKTSV